MTTIIDVEKMSGVSRSTISRYLNGMNVRADNRRKIEEAIDALGFRRNPMASGLKSSKTFTVGWFSLILQIRFSRELSRSSRKNCLKMDIKQYSIHMEIQSALKLN